MMCFWHTVLRFHASVSSAEKRFPPNGAADINNSHNPAVLSDFVWPEDNFHPNSNGIGGIGNDLVGIIPPISQQSSGGYSLNQVNSFFAISSGTLRDQYSDRQTTCIYGKVNFGIDPSFVRYPTILSLIS